MALEMKYFVLKPMGDDQFAFASRCAMLEYAKCIELTDESLSLSLTNWVSREAEASHKRIAESQPAESNNMEAVEQPLTQAKRFEDSQQICRCEDKETWIHFKLEHPAIVRFLHCPSCGKLLPC